MAQEPAILEEEELPSPRKTKRLYTVPQKKRVVAVARQESIVAGSKIPRTMNVRTYSVLRARALALL